MCCDLGIGQAGEKGKYQRFSLDDTDLQQCQLHPAGIEMAENRVGDTVVTQGEVQVDVGLIPHAGVLAQPDSVDGAAARHPQDPGSAAAESRVELAGTLPDVQQHLLSHLVGLMAIAQESVGQRSHRGHFPAVQSLERRYLPRSDQDQELVARSAGRFGQVLNGA